MAAKRLLVVILALALGAVAVGAGYVYFTQKQSVTPPGAAPTVTIASPANGAAGVAINTKVLATFSKAMDPLTITATTFTVKHGATSVAGTVTYAGTTATFTPSANLAASTLYTATITTGVRDSSGRALASNFVWSFTTGTVADTAPPAVSSTSPPNAATGTPVNGKVTVVFSEAMNPSTITASTFTVKQGTTPVSGSVSYAGMTATFSPAANLAPSTSYTATVTTGAKDLAGNPLAADLVWSFTTAASASACSQGTVALGSAAGFAVVAGSTVTNTGSSIVTGDIGVSPGTEITGFPPGTVVGTIHAADTAAGSAVADVTIAYNDAAARTLCPVSVAGNLGGQTLSPGLYKSTSSLGILSGDLTLDAQGDANAVFIFQIASTLDVSDGLHVVLAGGAKAANIFWQVGTSATFGTTSAFAGTILADQSISFSTGATLDGRALARIGAVTLDGNTISKPAA